ncbi:MAG: hypothetical protein PHP64_06495 [Actinomycetota bacterium]|nr:hypothetical protein [Actinomycetota bacterium]
MENPELEFLQYLIRRFIEMSDIDVESTSIRELIDRIQDELTPIGGG